MVLCARIRVLIATGDIVAFCEYRAVRKVFCSWGPFLLMATASFRKISSLGAFSESSQNELTPLRMSVCSCSDGLARGSLKSRLLVTRSF